MAESGRLLAAVFEYLDTLDLIGTTTLQINDLVEHYIREDLQARPASKGQYGFEFVLNASINNVVCHGVPSPTDVLRDGVRQISKSLSKRCPNAPPDLHQ